MYGDGNDAGYIVSSHQHRLSREIHLGFRLDIPVLRCAKLGFNYEATGLSQHKRSSFRACTFRVSSSLSPQDNRTESRSVYSSSFSPSSGGGVMHSGWDGSPGQPQGAPRLWASAYELGMLMLSTVRTSFLVSERRGDREMNNILPYKIVGMEQFILTLPRNRYPSSITYLNSLNALWQMEKRTPRHVAAIAAHLKHLSFLASVCATLVGPLAVSRHAACGCYWQFGTKEHDAVEITNGVWRVGVVAVNGMVCC